MLAANCHRYVEAYMGVPAAGDGAASAQHAARRTRADRRSPSRRLGPRCSMTDRDPGPLADAVAAGGHLRRSGMCCSTTRRCTGANAEVSEDDLALAVLHRRHDWPAEGRDAQSSQPGRELVPQDAGVPLRARRRLPRGGAVLPRRRHGRARRAALAGRFVRDPPGVRPGDEPRRRSSGTACRSRSLCRRWSPRW